MYITAQGCRLQNDLYCVEWDVKLYYTIPYHTEPRLLIAHFLRIIRYQNVKPYPYFAAAESAADHCKLTVKIFFITAF